MSTCIRLWKNQSSHSGFIGLLLSWWFLWHTSILGSFLVATKYLFSCLLSKWSSVALPNVVHQGWQPRLCVTTHKLIQRLLTSLICVKVKDQNLQYEIIDDVIDAAALGSSCGQRLCECDRRLAECLSHYPCPHTKAVCTSSPWRLLQNLLML